MKSIGRICVSGYITPRLFPSIFETEKFFITLLSLLSFNGVIFPQTDYLMNISNGEQVDGNTYEFDILINSTASDFELTSYQSSFNFNQNIINDGTLSFSYIEGTSGLSNTPSLGIGLNNSDGSSELTFASMPGSDNISSTEIRVGRFRIENTNPFNVLNPNIIWNFSGNITTILTGSNFANITNPSNHLSEIGEAAVSLVQVVEVTASATTSIYNGPEKTIDGLGYNGGDANSIWRAQPTPQYLVYDLGFEQTVNKTRFSFYNFDGGRVYQYSVFLSNDEDNWTEIVSNASSGSDEWTENQFTSQKARYMKLLISSNNQNNWATIWEAEIWGYATTDITTEEEEIPQDFELSQNYPNPFNPSTNIQFGLKQDASVRLVVYNILGEEVVELINGDMKAGIHKVELNSSLLSSDQGGLSSGVYIYRLDINNEFSDSKKMVLLK